MLNLMRLSNDAKDDFFHTRFGNAKFQQIAQKDSQMNGTPPIPERSATCARATGR